MRFVRNTRRGPARDKSDWKVMLEINGSEVAPPDGDVPPEIMEHWKEMENLRSRHSRPRSESIFVG